MISLMMQFQEVDGVLKCQEVKEASGGRGSHLHLLSFDNILVVVGWRGQPHVAERQLSLWLPAGTRWRRQLKWVNDCEKITFLPPFFPNSIGSPAPSPLCPFIDSMMSILV